MWFACRRLAIGLGLLLLIFPQQVWAQGELLATPGPVGQDSVLMFPLPQRLASSSSSTPVFFQHQIDSLGHNLDLRFHPYYNFYGQGMNLYMLKREPANRDGLFYLLVVICLLYAGVKYFYPRYFANLTKLLLGSSLRSQPLNDTLLQASWPSWLLNGLFLLTAGLYGAFLLQYFEPAQTSSFRALFLFGFLILAGIYAGKYILLQLLGWTLRIQSVTQQYLFIVFFVNKVTGIFLLPVLVVLAFPFLQHAPVVIPFSVGMLVCLLLYRFWISFQQLNREINVNLFHFFIYLCGFEIAPLLVIFKVILGMARGNV
jgi:hypothetical protein